jgi:hypothetical protein
VDVVFVLIAHSDPGIVVERRDPREVAGRMANATIHEQRDFFGYYRAFKFGFPERTSHILEGAEEDLRSRLSDALAGKRTHVVSHPYGGPLDDLFRAMEPHCASPPPD